MAGLLDNPEFLNDILDINPARYVELMENVNYFITFSLVFKCKELGLTLNAYDFDIDEINSMFTILEINREKERRKAASGRKT